MKKFLNEKTIPWVLLFFTLLAYLPLVNQMGFYWDDWPMLWFKITQGADGFLHAFDSDRPFLGALYKITAEIFGNKPLIWQIGTVFFRWTVTLAFWWMLKQLWPDHPKEVFCISLLLSVYPGFKQMPIVYVWLNAFIMLLAYVLSYGMMLKAIRSGSKKAYLLWTIPSVFLFTFCTISTEYYTGLEVSRGVILWIFLWQRGEFEGLSFWKRVWKVIRHWLPYILILAAFMIWRVFVFQFQSYQPTLLTELANSPLKAVWGVLKRIFTDAYTATWGAWIQNFHFPGKGDITGTMGKLFWAFVFVGIVSAMAALFGFKHSDEKDETARARWCRLAMGLGAFMVICPGFPYWVTSLPIKLSYPYDRFLVAFMFGSSIFMTGLIELVLRTQAQRNIAFSLFIAMAVGGNILNANTYRKDWEMQKDFTEQLTARIPELEENTILMTDSNPLAYESDNSLTGLVNLALKPEGNGLELPYSVDIFSLRFDDIDTFKNGGKIWREFRSAMFHAYPEDMVTFIYNPPGCLRVLDPEQHSELPIFPESYYPLIGLSNIDRINTKGTGSAFLRENVFGMEPSENWCYFFEKADLARQDEDWETIAEIGDRILPWAKAGEASEYFVYAEAYAHLNRWDDAVKMLQNIHDMNKNLDPFICKRVRGPFQDYVWSQGMNAEIYEIAGMLNTLGCSAFSEE